MNSKVGFGLLTITMNPSLDKVYSVDDFQVGRVFRPRRVTATAGGKGLNVARVAAILGVAVTATGVVGGRVGAFIQEEVERRNIRNRFVPIAGETRICINITDEVNQTSTEILEPGPTVQAEEIEKFLATYEEALDECHIVAGSGSLPQGLPKDFYRQLISRAKAKGRRFVLDTSGDYLVEGLREQPYAIKPNQEELAKLSGKDTTDLQICVRLLIELKETGIELPVVTLGAAGCLAALDDGVYHFFGPPVKVVNPVGSGDSFVAGLAVGLLRGKDKQESIKLAMACGMANTQFFQTGMVSLDLVEKFQQGIQARRL